MDDAAREVESATEDVEDAIGDALDGRLLLKPRSGEKLVVEEIGIGRGVPLVDLTAETDDSLVIPHNWHFGWPSAALGGLLKLQMGHTQASLKKTFFLGIGLSTVIAPTLSGGVVVAIGLSAGPSVKFTLAELVRNPA